MTRGRGCRAAGCLVATLACLALDAAALWALGRVAAFCVWLLAMMAAA